MLKIVQNQEQGASRKKFGAAEKEVIAKVQEAESKVKEASAAGATLKALVDKTAAGEIACPSNTLFAHAQIRGRALTEKVLFANSNS